MRTFRACEGVTVRQQRQRALEAHPLRRDLDVGLRVVVVGGGRALGLRVRGLRWVAGEPGRGVGDGGCVGAGVRGVVHEALEADVGVVLGVAVWKEVSVSK